MTTLRATAWSRGCETIRKRAVPPFLFLAMSDSFVLVVFGPFTKPNSYPRSDAARYFPTPLSYRSDENDANLFISICCCDTPHPVRLPGSGVQLAVIEGLVSTHVPSGVRGMQVVTTLGVSRGSRFPTHGARIRRQGASVPCLLVSRSATAWGQVGSRKCRCGLGVFVQLGLSPPVTTDA